MELYFTNLCYRVVINPVQNFLGDCVYIVLFIPAAFKYVYQIKSVIWFSCTASFLFHSLKAASHQRISSAIQLLHADPRLSLAFQDSWQNCH